MLALARQLPALRGSKQEVSAVGAMLQDRRAGAEDVAAAHVLPCQLLIGGRPPWQIALPEPLRLAFAARFCATVALPVPFNRADSEAEAAGLAATFLRAARQAWDWKPVGSVPASAVIGAQLQQLAATLVSGARAAFAAGAAQKRARDAAGDPLDSGRSDERLVEALLLDAYGAGVPSASELARLVDWDKNVGCAYPWHEWLTASP